MGQFTVAYCREDEAVRRSSFITVCGHELRKIKWKMKIKKKNLWILLISSGSRQRVTNKVESKKNGKSKILSRLLLETNHQVLE